jgi:hypothetical protein
MASIEHEVKVEAVGINQMPPYRWRCDCGESSILAGIDDFEQRDAALASAHEHVRGGE